MERIIFTVAITDCAVACAMKRRKRQCKDTFGGGTCNYCRLDIRMWMLTLDTSSYSCFRQRKKRERG